MHPTVLFLLLWQGAALVGFVEATAVLKQLHVITRHGARTPLAKNGDTLEEQAGSTLTPNGQKQLFEVGQWLREVYQTNEFLEFYDPAEVRLESSNLDRTISSANSLSMGLFPFNAHAGNHGTELFESLLPEMPSIPVYSIAAENDIYFRAYYQTCPKFQRKLQSLYRSFEWTNLEENSQEILKKIAVQFPNVDDFTIKNNAVVMKHLWTYYDKIHVARTECLDSPDAFACTELGDEGVRLANAFSDSEFEELENLMGETESLRYQKDVAGNLLGSNLLWRILDRALFSQQKFFLYSAHTNTLQALLAAMQTQQTVEALPDFASAIIIEFYEDRQTSVKTLRVLYKSLAEPVATEMDLDHINCNVQTTMASQYSNILTTHCEYSKFVDWAIENTMNSPATFCSECENLFSDVCLLAKFESLDRKAGEAFSAVESTLAQDGKKPVLLGGMFLLGFLVAGLFIYVVKYRRRKKEEEPPPPSPQNLRTVTVAEALNQEVIWT